MNKRIQTGQKNSDLYIPGCITTQGGLMNEQQDIELRLWHYLDGLGSSAERSAIEQLIAENREWQIAYQSLLETQNLLKNSELEQPSIRFTKNVMEEIAKYHVAPATKNYINKNIIRGIAGFFITTLLGLLIYTFSRVNWSAPASTPGILNKYKVPELNWTHYFNNSYTSVFIMINVVLGLVMLDIYLRRKKDEVLRNRT